MTMTLIIISVSLLALVTVGIGISWWMIKDSDKKNTFFNFKKKK